MSETFDPVAETRRLMRVSLVGSLATLDRNTGAPSASMAAVASDPDGAPILLISQLAMHTKNLEADGRASLLLDARTDADESADPMTRPRVSLSGVFSTTDDARVRARFLSLHPDAAMYADFKDFAFWRMDLSDAYLVAGFGRIHSLEPEKCLVDISGKDALIDAESEIVEHLNDDHADTLQLYASHFAPADGAFDLAAVRCVSCDPEGLVLRSGMNALRIPFPAIATTPGDVRKALKALADRVRSAAD